MIEFTIYGNPVAQGRPRAFKDKAGNVRVYDPTSAREWKQLVKAQATLNRRTEKGLIEGPIILGLYFFLVKPKSLPKKVKRHIKRPDLDNLGKAVKDGLKGVFYRDDSQIYREVLTKDYCKGNDSPRVTVQLISEDEI